MDFKFFYLKEETRAFDRTDLLNFFQSIPNVTIERKGEGRVFIYHHPILNFTARFVLATKSIIPHIERLNPRYLDVNFRVEFDIKLPTYCAELVLEIAEEIAKMFRFVVYNESYEDVVAFRKTTLIKTFEIWKNAYKNRNEDEIAAFSRLDPIVLGQIYNYILRRPKLEVLLDKNKTCISDYHFMRTDKSRIAFVKIKWDGYSPFIIPPAVDILEFEDSKERKNISMSELLGKSEKLLKPFEGYGNVRIVDIKAAGKLRKIINKTKFSPITADLKEIALEEILDI